MKPQKESVQEDAGYPPFCILIAEDDQDDSFLLERAFARAGVKANLKIIHDGQQVLDYLSRTPPYDDPVKSPPPTLLLLDLKMPRLDGFEVLEWLRQHPVLCDLPVVVLSGSDQKLDMNRARSLGARHYLVKPQSLDQLVQMAKSLETFWRATRKAHQPQPVA